MSDERYIERTANEFALDLKEKFNLPNLPYWGWEHECEVAFSLWVSEFGVPNNDAMIITISFEEDWDEVDEGQMGRCMTESFAVAIREITGKKDSYDKGIRNVKDALDCIEGAVSDMMEEV